MIASDPDSSWWLKVARAKEHLDHVKTLLDGARDPNLTVVRVEKELRDAQWIYTAHHDWAVPEMLPLVIGDFLFNLRSALDHIAAANMTSSVNAQSHYRIFSKDVRLANSQESKAHPKWHKGWNEFKAQFSPEVFAVIESLQPFQTAAKQATNPDDEALAILNDLQNADKHTRLNVVDTGVGDLVGFVFDPGTPPARIGGDVGFPDGIMVPNGAKFLALDREVHVELFGVVKVAVSGGRVSTYREIPESLGDILDSVRYILRLIEIAM